MRQAAPDTVWLAAAGAMLGCLYCSLRGAGACSGATGRLRMGRRGGFLRGTVV